MSTTIKRLFFDIETCPCAAWVWSTGKQYVGPENILEPSRIICIAYKWEGNKTVHSLRWGPDQCDKAMLEKFAEIVGQADEVVGHNGKNFDIRHINARVAYHELQPLDFGLVEDTLLKLRRQLRLPSYKLDYLAKYFKVGKKLETGGLKLWMDVWLDNKKSALTTMVKYCKQDVVLLENVYTRLKPYMPTTLNAAVLFGDSTLCPSCAAPLIKHGTRMMSQLRRVQRWRCTSCGKNFSSGTNLIKNTAKFPRP